MQADAEFAKEVMAVRLTCTADRQYTSNDAAF